MILQKAPFLRILPAFMAGIMLEHYHVLPHPGWIPAAAAAVMLLVIYSSLSTARKFRLYFVGGCAIQVLVASAGGLVARQADIRNRADWFGHHIVTNPPVVLTLLERPVEKTKSFKAVARFEGYVDSARLQPAKGKIILYIEKSAARSISFGSRLVTRARLREIRSSGNPGTFDYHSFCLSDGITHQVYLRQGNFIQAGRQADFLRSIVNVSRVWTTRTFEKYFPEQKERGLAEALLIGYKDELDKGLVQSYSNTGVVHVIAISGLHLGLIYWLLLLVTRPLARLGWLRLILVIASLWLFSIIAGGQPSVLRSAVMFTFLAAARATDRKTNIFNTLAMSAFVLLAWNPLWLWDAGFQLSYGALVGILVFYQPLSRWLLFSNRMLVFLWQLVAVTLTAQVFTLPISIFWFHQVPLLFMLSNIVAVPLSGIILMGEIFFCIISFVPLLAEAVAGLLQFMIRVMNGYVERIDSISFSVWQDLYLPLPAVLLLGVLFCSFCMWVMWRQHGWVYIGLLSLAAMTGILRSRIHAQLSQSRIIVYNLPGRSMTDLVLSRSAYTYPDHATGNDAFMLKMHIAPSRLMHGITGTQVMHAGVYHAGPATIAVLDSTNAGRVFKLSKVDLLIVTGKKTRDSETILSRVRPGFVVADGSMPEWAAIHWKRACSARKVPFHHVLTDGCYARDLTSLR